MCFYETTSSFAQESTNFDHQTAIDSSEVNQGVKWDSTRAPVTLSIRSGRSGRLNRTQDVTYDDDPHLFYSNEWQPILMPIRSNNQRDDRNKYQVENAYSPNYQFPPTFLRRPDSDVNRTASFESLNPTINDRDMPSPASVPMAPFMFYPHSFSLYPNANNQGGNKNVLQNSSTLVPGTVVSESETTISDENQSETSQPENFPVNLDISRRFFPGNFYSNAEGIQSPRASPYSPYPILPYPVIQPFQPVFNPNFNRQVGTGNISPLGVSQTESENSPDFVRNSEANLEDNIPGEAPPNIAHLPFPAGGYPYGLIPPLAFPPQFMPNVPLSRGRSVIPSGPSSRDPFIANFLPRGVSFNPFIPPPSILPDPQASGEVLPPPILNGNPPLELEGIVPQVANLQPGLQVPAELQVEAENILKSESQDARNEPFEFGYDMNDGQGNIQHRKEVSNGIETIGSYGYRDFLGVYRLVNYIADKDGFRAFIKSNEPGVASAGSANVVVMAESPPPNAILEGLKASQPQAVVVPDETSDLIAAGSESESK